MQIHVCITYWIEIHASVFFFLIGREFHQGIETWDHCKYQNTQPEAMHALIPIQGNDNIPLSYTVHGSSGARQPAPICFCSTARQCYL